MGFTFKDQSLWRKYPNFPQRDLNLYVPHISSSNGPVSEVRRRKLGTIIIQTVHILHHDDVVTGSLSEGGIMPGKSKLLPNDLARQYSSIVTHLYQ